MTLATHEPTSSPLIPADLDAQMHYASVISESGLLPDVFRGKPANVLVAIALAGAMDESLLTITGNLTMVGSKPGWEAKFMRQRARRFGHRIVETFDRATMTATCTIFRADDPRTPITVTVDKARATASGWWGKGYWQKDPQLMLENRALSFCVRKACNEVLGGVNYTTDEVQDGVAGPVEQAPASGWYARVDAAASVPELSALWSEAHRAHALDVPLQDYMKARRDLLTAPVAKPASATMPMAPAAERVDTTTGEIVDADVIEPQAEPVLDAAAPIKRATGQSIVRELVRCGVVAESVDAYLPALGIPRALAELTQDEAVELLEMCRTLTRDKLADLMADAAGSDRG